MKFLGVTDEITTCELCGKSNLKRTVVIETAEGNIVHYGCDCAARSLRKSIKGIKTQAVNGAADVMAYAQKWLKVYDLKIVSDGIWNKFGYLTEVRGNVISVKTDVGLIEIGK